VLQKSFINKAAEINKLCYNPIVAQNFIVAIKHDTMQQLNVIMALHKRC